MNLTLGYTPLVEACRKEALLQFRLEGGEISSRTTSTGIISARLSRALANIRAWLIWHACELSDRLSFLRYLRA